MVALVSQQLVSPSRPESSGGRGLESHVLDSPMSSPLDGVFTGSLGELQNQLGMRRPGPRLPSADRGVRSVSGSPLQKGPSARAPRGTQLPAVPLGAGPPAEPAVAAVAAGSAAAAEASAVLPSQPAAYPPRQSAQVCFEGFIWVYV